MDRFLYRIPKSNSDPNIVESTERRRPSGSDESQTAKRPRLDKLDGSSKTRPDGNDPHTHLSRKASQFQDEDGDLGLEERAFLTPLESSTGIDKTDQEVVAEYEALKASEAAAAREGEPGRPPGHWASGRSSIYVDAFNMALDTVLEDESHLFDEKDAAVFQQWRALDYEAQYLYVRLFLRKAASWHRVGRLKYYSDIGRPQAAIGSLQASRRLPSAVKPKPPVVQTAEQGPTTIADDADLGETFTFVDSSDPYLSSLDEAASLLSLDELKTLARDFRAQGKNKAELVKSVCRIGQQQTGLLALGIRRTSSAESRHAIEQKSRNATVPKLSREDSNRVRHFMSRILAVTGPCIRLTPSVYRLFERLHLVFYRSTEWTEKSLTTIILAKIARRNYPDYLICRTSNIFASRQVLLEFEAAIKTESEVDKILEAGPSGGAEGFRQVVEVLDRIYPRWQALIRDEGAKEASVYEAGEGAYLRRFTPGHSYTRVVHKAAYALGRLKQHAREHALLAELLEQRLFHTARRGSWHQRRALLEENYMHELDPTPVSVDSEQQRKHWWRKAAATCEAGLQDNECHLIYHHGLQKRLVKLEKRLRVPRRLRHDFGHVKLREPVEHTVEGIQIRREAEVMPGRLAASTRTVWVDELQDGGECSVEDMCLGWYRRRGWKGYHSEGGVVRTLFALIFFDVLFAPLPNVFQTPYQTCPLDLHTDAFAAARASEINRRLADVSNGAAEGLVRDAYARHGERRTCVVGLSWDFSVEDLAELARCFGGGALAAVCQVLAQEYRQRGGGMPDLVLWRTEDGGGGGGQCMFVEVKSKGDRLSDTQRLWIHVLTAAGIEVALCHAVAKEVREC